MAKNMDDNSNVRNTISLIISFLSLVVGILTLSLTFFIWRVDQSPSIRATCTSSIINDSFEIINNDRLQYGRFALDISLIVENTSNQGYYIDCQPIIRKKYEDGSIQDLKYSTKLFYKDGVDPFSEIYLDAHGSILLHFDLYIYLSYYTIQKLEENFGDQFYDAAVTDLLSCISKNNIFVELCNPEDTVNNNIDEDVIRNVLTSWVGITNRDNDEMFLSFISSTGATDTIGVNYLYQSVTRVS